MNWLKKQMMGSYGSDNLSRELTVLALILSIVNMKFRSRFLSALVLGIFMIVIFRTFSKNIARRQLENSKYLSFTYPIRLKFSRLKNRWANRKDYKYFKCKNCRKDLRVPRGKGTLEVTCPHCKKKMIKKS